MKHPGCVQHTFTYDCKTGEAEDAAAQRFRASEYRGIECSFGAPAIAVPADALALDA